jgi:uncharacterized membrane-anchored protein
MLLTDVVELIFHTSYADRKITTSGIYNLKASKEAIHRALGSIVGQGQRRNKEDTDLHHLSRIFCVVFMFSQKQFVPVSINPLIYTMANGIFGRITLPFITCILK